MTHLEQLIQQRVAATVIATVSRATDTIAEEMAREILRDPAFRQQMQELIRRAFTATVAQVATPVPPVDPSASP